MATIKGLKFDGGNDRLTFSNESLIGDFEVGIDFITGSSVTGAGNSGYTLLGSNSVDNIFFRYSENNKFAVNLGGAGADKQFDFTLSDNLLTNTRYFWIIKRVGQLVTVTDKELNSVVAADWATSTKDAVVNSFGSKGLTVSSYFNGILLSLGINNARLFDVDASNSGAGSTVITDTISGQNATGIGFPTDGSQFVDVDNGTGLDVNATLGTISYSSQAASVSITGSVDLISTLGTIDYSSNNASVSLTGDIELTATLGTINYDSNNVVISLTGSVDITPTLGTINYSSNNANVLIASDLVVNTTLGTINYESNSAEITLSGLVDVSATLGTITYTSNKVLVSVGQGQKIGNITAGFADNDISVKYKLNGITVNFK